MSTILLIRHGESQSNIGMPTLSPEDVALTQLGIDQALCIAQYLAYEIHPNLIVTSSYKRTKQTAVPTMLRFPSVREEEWPVYEFTYLSEKAFRGLTSVEDRKPLKEMYWEICDPTFIDGPGSESFAQFIGRVHSVIRRFEKLVGDRSIAIFSHEQFICAVYWLLERKPEHISSEAMQDFRDFLSNHSIPNGGFLRLERPDADYPWQLELANPLLAAVV